MYTILEKKKERNVNVNIQKRTNLKLNQHHYKRNNKPEKIYTFYNIITYKHHIIA
jgi:hypothetical protein